MVLLLLLLENKEIHPHKRLLMSFLALTFSVAPQSDPGCCPIQVPIALPLLQQAPSVSLGRSFPSLKAFLEPYRFIRGLMYNENSSLFMRCPTLWTNPTKPASVSATRALIAAHQEEEGKEQHLSYQSSYLIKHLFYV